MALLTTSATIELTDASGQSITAKDRHFLRMQLQTVLDEAVLNLYDKLGYVHNGTHAVRVEEIEVEEEPEH